MELNEKRLRESLRKAGVDQSVIDDAVAKAGGKKRGLFGRRRNVSRTATHGASTDELMPDLGTV